MGPCLPLTVLCTNPVQILVLRMFLVYVQILLVWTSLSFTDQIGLGCVCITWYDSNRFFCIITFCILGDSTPYLDDLVLILVLPGISSVQILLAWLY